MKVKWRREDIKRERKQKEANAEDVEEMKGADVRSEKKFYCITSARLQCSLV